MPHSKRSTTHPGLTDRQVRLIEEYMVDGNITRAAIRAGYSPKGARQAGEHAIKLPAVAAALAALQAQRSTAVGLLAEDVLRELSYLVHSSIRDFEVTDNGDVTLREGVPETAWRALASVKKKTDIGEDADGKTTYTHTVEIRLWDKNTAIANAMKHLGLLKEGAHLHLHKHDHSHEHVWQIGGREIAFR